MNGMTLRNPIQNEDERQEMFELIRKRVRKETGKALHFNQDLKKGDVLFWAVEEAYFYILNKKDIPISCLPEDMLAYITKELGEMEVKVLEKYNDAVKIMLKNHIWWLCLGSFSAYDSQIPWSVSYVGVDGGTDSTKLFPVTMGFERIIPMLDELFPQIEDVAIRAAEKKNNGNL